MTDDTKSTPHDRAPLPESAKEKLFQAISAENTLGENEFELLWSMIESATWEYRQSLFARLNVDAVLDAGYRLAGQMDKQLGINAADFETIAFAMMRDCACAGFFGIYMDRWLIEP